MNTMPQIEQLSLIAAPYAESAVEDDHLFEAAMQEADNWHRAHNPAYAMLWQEEQRPLIPVGLFKRVALGTPVDGDGLWLSSSGTGKNGAAAVFFDVASMARIERGMRHIFYHHSMVNTQPARFLLLSPDPRRSSQPGYATSFLRFTACAPVSELIFAVNEAGCFQPELAWGALTRWIVDPVPIFLFGLTVHFEHLALSAPIAPLASNTIIQGLTGGGWKGMTRQLKRPDIIARLAQALGGVNGDRRTILDIRDIFGMTEHPLHYISCPLGRFHIPRYSRLSVLAADGTPAPPGEAGLIRLQNPFFASLPSHDLLSEDLGCIGLSCPCGDVRPWLEFHGRVGDPKATCAWHASISAGGV